MFRYRGRLFLDSRYLREIYYNSFSQDYISKKHYLFLMKVVFLGFKLYLSFLKSSQYYFNILLILFQVLRIDQNIIQVVYIYNVQLGSKQVIESSLVYYQYVRESKQHNLVFVKSILGPKHCFLFFLFLDLYQVVYFTKI